jgi:hypothetical protein
VKQIGEPILKADRITLAFGGVTALNAISSRSGGMRSWR